MVGYVGQAQGADLYRGGVPPPLPAVQAQPPAPGARQGPPAGAGAGGEGGGESDEEGEGDEAHAAVGGGEVVAARPTAEATASVALIGRLAVDRMGTRLWRRGLDLQVGPPVWERLGWQGG
jgi:hypothetical protein